MKIAMQRARAGMELDIVESIYDRWHAGGDLGQSLIDELVQRAIDRWSEKILHAMQRAGLEVDAAEPLTSQSIAAAISAKTGLDMDDLTPEKVAAAADGRMSSELSRALGVEVSSVLDPVALKAQLIAGAMDAVQSGRATSLMPKATINSLRMAASWGRAGVSDKLERRRIMANWYAKKYRRKHRQVWD